MGKASHTPIKTTSFIPGLRIRAGKIHLTTEECINALDRSPSFGEPLSGDSAVNGSDSDIPRVIDCWFISSCVSQTFRPNGRAEVGTLESPAGWIEVVRWKFYSRKAVSAVDNKGVDSNFQRDNSDI